MARKDISDRQVCEAYQAYAKDSNDSPEKYLMRVTGQPEKVCWSAMDRACDRGLVEFGVNLRAGWLTDKGKALLWNLS